MALRQTQGKRLVLVDGFAIIYRAYHAFTPNLKTRKGEMVNAVYGFTRMLLGVIKDLEPEYLVVAFDVPYKLTFRHREFIGYQAKRPQMEEEMAGQIKRVHQVVESLNIPHFEIEGYEADDIIGTLARQAVKKGLEVVIVTGDRDLMQLVNSQVQIYAPVKGFAQAKFFDEKEVEGLLGIKPKQVVDYKAMVGDSSDNYPGVSGIGPKTAVKLLREYRNLESIYRNLAKLPKLVADKLIRDKEAAELSRKLATILVDAPIKLNLKACLVKDYNQQKAIELFQELEFKSLIDKLPGVEKEEEKKKESEQIKLL